jgi:hypothetical protein
MWLQRNRRAIRLKVSNPHAPTNLLTDPSKHRSRVGKQTLCDFLVTSHAFRSRRWLGFGSRFYDLIVTAGARAMEGLLVRQGDDGR